MSTPQVTGAYPDTLMPTVYVPRSSAENRNLPDPAVASAASSNVWNCSRSPEHLPQDGIGLGTTHCLTPLRDFGHARSPGQANLTLVERL